MILLDISGASAIVRKQDILTSGMVGANVVFCFDEDWNNLAKTAVFRASKVVKDAVVVDSVSEIPHEVLAVPGIPLEIGVYGTADDGAVVIPTIWAKTNIIKRGTDPSGDESLDPSLPIWAQMQEQLDSMYRSSEEINAAKEEILQAIEEGKEDINAAVAAGGYYTKLESGSKFASAISKTLSGEMVVANDASPIEHPIKITVSGDDITDLSAVTVTMKSKNLLNPTAFVRLALGTNNSTGATYVASANTYRGFYLPCEAGDVFSLSRLAVNTNRFRCVFTAEEPAVSVTCFGGTLNTDTYDSSLKIENIVAPANAKYIFVYLSNQAEKISGVQLEYGSTATMYTEYVAPTTYTPNVNGVVDGVISIPSGMILYTDTAGATLNVEYNRDSNAVIAELLAKSSPAARIADITLLASKWVGSGTLYSQVVSIAGVTENSQVNLTPSVEQLSIFYNKDLTFITENDGGMVTVYVIGQKPQNDYTIQADIVEVIA